MCDNTTTNPGIPLVDKHYQVDFQDKRTVLDIAKREGVQGVISNSEAAMPIVAYVSETLGLVGNPVKSVQTLNSKFAFRDLQKKLGFFSPKHFITDSFVEACAKAKELNFPLIIKPCRSSGSRGTLKIDSYEDFILCEEPWHQCSLYSLNRKVVIEEFVEMPNLDRVIDGDIFLHKGKIIWDGLFTSIRSPLQPMLPMTQVFPINLKEQEITEVKYTVEHLLSGAGIQFGEFNIELYYSKHHQLFCIEINARQGGNGIPYMVQKHSGIDMYKLLVTTVMGHDEYFNEIISSPHECNYIARHPVFCHQLGVYKGLTLTEEIKPFVTNIQSFGFEGKSIDHGTMTRNKVAMVDLEFPDRLTQLRIIEKIEEYIIPQIDSRGGFHTPTFA